MAEIKQPRVFLVSLDISGSLLALDTQMFSFLSVHSPTT